MCEGEMGVRERDGVFVCCFVVVVVVLRGLP